MNHLDSMNIISPTLLMTDIELAQVPWLSGVLWSLTSPSTEWTKRTGDLTSTSAHLAYIRKLAN